MGEDASSRQSDLRAALLTGAAGWRDRYSRYTAPELLTVAVLGGCVAAVATVLLVSAGLPAGNAAVVGPARWLVAVSAVATLLVVVAPSFAWPLGWRPRRLGPTVWFAPVRVGAVMLVVGCWTALLGMAAPWPIWALGAILGCEYTLTAWVLGLRTSGRRWWWSFQRSSIHLGTWLLTLAVAAANPGQLGELLHVPLSFQVVALGAAATCWILERLRRQLDQLEMLTSGAAVSEVHRRLADWLHDDVGNEVKKLRSRLHTAQVALPEIDQALGRLDQRLRTVQLDEMLAAGWVQLAQVVQAYVGLARLQGVEVGSVPRFEQGRMELDGEAGRLVRRIFAVLVPNAIAAGATVLAFRVGTIEPDCLWVEVEDDAGGFDLARVPAGRGLDRLRHELGGGNLTCTPTDRGSCVRATIHRNDGAP